MRVQLPLLEKFVSLPDTDPNSLRHLFDDLGLEVKQIDEVEGNTEFTIETLAQRSDHLSIMGVARELSARNLSAIKYPSVVPELHDAKVSMMVGVHTEDCLRYALMEMSLPETMSLRKDVAEFLESPDEGRHALVHILNYVQMELGQPMHAFDRSKVKGEVRVVKSDAEETIEALDGKSYTVPVGSLLIRDKEKIIAVAGVIGCANSMIEPGCRRALIESATFDPVCVRKTARAMGLSTDSSYLFERGGDTELVLYALRRVLYLAAGSAGIVKSDDVAHDMGYIDIAHHVPELPEYKIPLKRFKSAMNLPRLNDVEIISRLKYQGYQVTTSDDKKTLAVKVPSWRRFSVQSAATVIEDFARSHGLNQAKPTLPPLDYERAEPEDVDRVLSRIESVLVGNGFLEVVSRSYYGSAEADLIARLHPETASQQVTLNNSLDKGYSHLKQTNVIHLARILDNYVRRGGQGARIFEIGQLFAKQPPVASAYDHEHTVYSMAAIGRWNCHEWKKPEPVAERSLLFRGVIESVFRSLGSPCRFVPGQHPLLHPGRQACIMVGKEACGYVGSLHPAIAQFIGLNEEVHIAELYHNPLVSCIQEQLLHIASDYPSIRRDITIKVPERAFAGEIATRIAGMKDPFLTDVVVVDEFKKDDESFRRVTFRLTFQGSDRTLEHTEIDASMEAIIAKLADKDRLEVV